MGETYGGVPDRATSAFSTKCDSGLPAGADPTTGRIRPGSPAQRARVSIYDPLYSIL
jgi:hypothetical protein